MTIILESKKLFSEITYANFIVGNTFRTVKLANI